jgi:hypothetical protein
MPPFFCVDTNLKASFCQFQKSEYYISNHSLLRWVIAHLPPSRSQSGLAPFP